MVELMPSVGITSSLIGSDESAKEGPAWPDVLG
jgi:hypothetical protein